MPKRINCLSSSSSAPPHFNEKSVRLSVRKGDRASLICEANGDQPMEVTWRRNGIPISSDEDARYFLSSGFFAMSHPLYFSSGQPAGAARQGVSPIGIIFEDPMPFQVQHCGTLAGKWERRVCIALSHHSYPRSRWRRDFLRGGQSVRPRFQDLSPFHRG